ncbi:MAG: polyprenyl synthetase family protein [Pelolinea sp.]|nr:polyprenyl synthetase family protein [Pelolinea sp.]
MPVFLFELEEYVNSYFKDPYSELKTLFRYHLGLEDASSKQGKHIRPLLTLMSCAGTGSDWQKAIPAAVSIELIHHFSLIHDDIEDNGLLRRGKDAVWVKWGLPQGLNAGDAMFASAFRKLIDLKKNVSDSITLDAVELLSDTCQRLTQGQYLDIDFENRPVVSVKEYLSMVRGKTAALISCSTKMGALIGGYIQEEQCKYEDFGEALGVAFQIYDDWLGIWGDHEVTGKSVTSDIVDGKKSLPILLGLEKSSQFASRFAQGEIAQNEAIIMAKWLQEDGIEKSVTDIYTSWTEKAFLALEKMSCAVGVKTALEELANKLLIRKK